MTAPARSRRPRATPGRGEVPAAEAPGVAATIVHVAAECSPFARTGGLAEAVAALAGWQARSGARVAVVLPYYRAARRVAQGLVTAGRPIAVGVGSRSESFRLLRLRTAAGAPRVFFVEHDGYFDRPGLYGHGGSDFGDNGMRFGFFATAALAALPRVARGGAVILHAHDWHAALAPVFLRTRFTDLEYYRRVRTVLSIHNAAFHGHFPPELLRVIGLPDWLYDWPFLEWYGRVNFLKGGMAFADHVVTVSPNHAAELRTPMGGFGLHEAFQSLGDRLSGIVNGIDQGLWDPETDEHLFAPYSADELSGKGRNKAAIQRFFGLPRHPHDPLIGMAARLATQKGLDLVVRNPDLLTGGAQYAFVGRGEARFETALADLAAHSHQRVGVKLQFTERLAHRLIGGSDVFLLPSLYEPCGLTQMESQRMGTLPIGRRVGGLADTIEDGVTGFLFDEFTPRSLADAVRRALGAYRDRDRWTAMMRAAMARDFSWGPSAERYAAVYRRVLAGAPAGG